MSSVFSVDYYHRILDGIYTETKSLTIIFDYNAQQYVALQEGFIMDRIVDARHPNENL